MADAEEILENSTLGSIALPGSHDAFSYALTPNVAPDRLAFLPGWTLPVAAPLISFCFGSFIKDCGKTQHITTTQQLDAGIRLLDSRACLDQGGSWTSWHGTTTQNSLFRMLRDVDAWLRTNSEIVVLLLTHAGEKACDTDRCYGRATLLEQKHLWRAVVSAFGCRNGSDGCMLYDTSHGNMLHRPIRDLRQSHGGRAFALVSGWRHMTSSSSLATPISQALVETNYPFLNGNLYGKRAIQAKVTTLKNTLAHMQSFRQSQDRLTLLSLASAFKAWHISGMFLCKYAPILTRQMRRRCSASLVNLSDFDRPFMTLIEYAQLVNYYQQEPLMAAKRGLTFLPHLMYADEIEVDGTVRVSDNATSPYVTAILAWNFARRSNCSTAQCVELKRNVSHTGGAQWTDQGNGYTRVADAPPGSRIAFVRPRGVWETVNAHPEAASQLLLVSVLSVAYAYACCACCARSMLATLIPRKNRLPLCMRENE